MRKKLNNILLVDDDKDCNFFHQRLLNKMDCVDNVFIATDGQLALDFLITRYNENLPAPDIIFLDINMPRKNGWEFINDYKKLDKKAKAKVVIVMIGSSGNIDIEQLNQFDEVTGYENKYLEMEALENILSKYFPDYV